MAISDIRKGSTPRRRRETPWQPCATCALLADITPAEAKHIRALLADPEVRYSWLAEQLEERGKPVDWQALSRHARGICSAREKLRGK